MYNFTHVIFSDATQELIQRGAKAEVYCDYVKSEFRAFLGQLPKKKGQHYEFEKQYLQSYKNQQPMSKILCHCASALFFEICLTSSGVIKVLLHFSATSPLGYYQSRFRNDQIPAEEQRKQNL